MTKVNRITISGFRGIRTKLDLDLRKGAQAQSIILYGANGTGKSSITDAWEWLTTGKIQHLAREGAEEGAYPHMAAEPGSTYVEAEFSDSAIGTVSIVFDEKRVTIPKAHGNLEPLRRLLTHPCHIRYNDLTRFVLLRKAERYDALASLMGFAPQMEYQKALRRVEFRLESDVAKQVTLLKEAEELFKRHFRLSEIDHGFALTAMASVCIAQGFETEVTADGVRESSKKLEAALTADPNAKKLADMQTLQAAAKASKAPPNLQQLLADLRGAVAQLKAEQKDHLYAQMSVPLFEAADALLARTEETGRCPLCHQCFEGDLKQHVKNELASLRHLQLLLTKLQNARRDLSESLSAHKGLVIPFQEATETMQGDQLDPFHAAFKNAAKAVDDAVCRLSTLLAFDSTNLTDELTIDLKAEEDVIAEAITSFEAARTSLLTEVQNRKALLEKDPARAKLVSDYRFVTNGLSCLTDLSRRKSEVETARKLQGEFSSLVDDYVKSCLEDVQKRFDEISDQVKVFFETLEKNTEGLGSPQMRLLTDQDRSVVLEVVFHGAMIDPAHKYLSESQLNSFGLAVFIASATHFNKVCPFLILDDVVNSFDAYKRPQLIELLKDHLKGHQVLLLTHDRLWRDLLHRRLPTWKRTNFTNYSFGVGPMMSPGMNALERVEAALAKDETEDASGTFARYLEDIIQDLCEAFEVELKFNRRGEYTLDTLLDRLKVRVREKLKPEHPLSKAIERMFQDNAYRNWSVHCKDPVSPIQSAEIRLLVANWKDILKMVQCPSCFDLLKYDGDGGFACGCGKSQLNRGSLAE